MRPCLLTAGFLIGLGLLVAAIWTGIQARQVSVEASRHLEGMDLQERLQALPKVRQADQEILGHYVFLIELTLAGLLICAGTLAATSRKSGRDRRPSPRRPI